MVGREHDDLLAEDRASKVGDGHMDGLDAALTLHIGIDPREIVDDADDDLVARGIRRRSEHT